MKKSIIKSAFWITVTILFLAIAIPTFSIKIRDREYTIRGLHPKDFSKSFIVQEFNFHPSLELNGGNIATIKVDMEDVEEDNRDIVFEDAKNSIQNRLLRLKQYARQYYSSFDFELQKLQSTDNSEYKLLLRLPEFIDREELDQLFALGDVSIWIEVDEGEALRIGEEMPYGQRNSSDLSNSDILKVSIISDASCIFTDDKAPKNFCIKTEFKPTSQSNFNIAFANSNYNQYPPLILIDGAPMGVKSLGQPINPNNPGLSIIWYPLLDDNWEKSAIFASVIGQYTLPSNISIEEYNTFEPSINADTLQSIKIAILVSFIVVNVLLFVFYKNQAWFSVLLNGLFVIFSVALMKMFGSVVLDTSLIYGFLLSFCLFLVLTSYFQSRLKSRGKKGITSEEVKEELDNIKKHYSHITIVVCIFAFIITYYAPTFLYNLYLSFGFGIIAGYIILALPAQQLLSILFLKSSKWKMW